MGGEIPTEGGKGLGGQRRLPRVVSDAGRKPGAPVGLSNQAEFGAPTSASPPGGGAAYRSAAHGAASVLHGGIPTEGDRGQRRPPRLVGDGLKPGAPGDFTA